MLPFWSVNKFHIFALYCTYIVTVLMWRCLMCVYCER